MNLIYRAKYNYLLSIKGKKLNRRRPENLTELPTMFS
jgi:hypothetical protein